MTLRASDLVAISEARARLTELAEDVIVGLEQALAGQFVSDVELDEALGVKPG
jgi:hypothetical protein